MLVLTVLAFTTILGLGLFTLGETCASNRDKIVAALNGRSLLAGPALVTRPVSVRIVSRPVSQPVSARPRMRVAA